MTLHHHLLLLCTVSSILFSNDLSWQQYKRQTLNSISSFPGWCSQEKASSIMELIREERPYICVEIGTFGGSTSFAITRALKYIHQGTLYSIDAWDNQIALEGIDDEEDSAYWASIDFKKVKKTFIELMDIYHLQDRCKVLEMTSQNAATLFAEESIDIVYIDGNFSTKGSLDDVKTYFSKVKKGGYIWLNDADADRKLPSVSFLMRNAVWIQGKSIRNTCLLFQK